MLRRRRLGGLVKVRHGKPRRHRIPRLRGQRGCGRGRADLCRSAGDVPIVATVYAEEHPLGPGRVTSSGQPMSTAGMATVSTGTDLQHRRGHLDSRDSREALRMAVRVALRIPAQLTLYSVLDQSSERYSYLVGRTNEQVFVDKARDSFGKSTRACCGGRAARSQATYGPPRGRGRGVVGWVESEGYRHAGPWLPRLAQSRGLAGWCLVAAGQARPATGSCRAAGHYRFLKGLS
jgi:hypothetical protein